MSKDKKKKKRRKKRKGEAEPVEVERKVDALGIPRIRRHIFLCCDQTDPKCCTRKRSLEAWDYLKRRLGELGLLDEGVYRTKANCLRVCRDGPIALVGDAGEIDATAEDGCAKPATSAAESSDAPISMPEPASVAQPAPYPPPDRVI